MTQPPASDSRRLRLIRNIRGLHGPFRFLRTPGAWLWIILALGALIRIYLVAFTAGTHDVTVWTVHARWTHHHGIVSFYDRSDVSNHPPLIVHAMSALWGLEQDLGVPFRVSLRAPFALLDVAVGLLLLRMLRGSRARFAALAAYWISPLPMIFSAYHGNTDTAVAFFALLATLAVAEKRPLWAGAALGVGLWIKVPVILVAPALLFALPSWRVRSLFAASAVVVAGAGYLPTILEIPELLYRRVFAYPGLVTTSHGGAPIWGIWNVFGAAARFPRSIGPISELHLAHNTIVSVFPVLLLAWLRRGQKSALELGWTIAASLLLFYGLSMRVSFQYLAWALPFWIFLGPARYTLLSVIIGAYVYGVYALVCGNPFLLGKWDWIAHPFFTARDLLLRDVSVLLCLSFGVGALIEAARAYRSREMKHA